MPQYHIPRELIDELRDRVDLVELVSEAGVVLRRSGKNFFGLCPFHQEDTPSFAVAPERQWYRCYGCNESGNAFNFLMKTEGLTFLEAVQQLADRVGMTLPGRDSSTNRPQIAGLRELHTFAVDYFHRQLLDHTVGQHALRYLRERGIKMETIQTFKLGFAPQEWDRLLKEGARAGYGLQLMLEGGLIKEREGKRYDTFRNRVMFPICDAQGNPIAFGGRALDDNPAKYLNSPETPIYQKSRVIYNLHAARPSIQQAEEAILVEGYMDTLIPYQEGIQNVVATLGTSLTEHHARLLNRFAKQVVITYDGDKAGFDAALRGLHLLLKEGLRVRVATLPAQMDPDDLVRQQGTEALQKHIQQALNLVVFQLQLFSRHQGRNLHEITDKAEIIKQLATTLSHVQSYAELSEYVDRAATDLMIDPPVLWQELRRLGVQIPKSQHRVTVPRKRGHPPHIERQLLECLFQQPELLAEAKQQIEPADFRESDYARIARLLWSWEGGDGELRAIISECEDERLRSVMVDLGWHQTIRGDVPQTFRGCLTHLRNRALKNLELSRKHEATNSNDRDALKELLELRARRKRLNNPAPFEEIDNS